MRKLILSLTALVLAGAVQAQTVVQSKICSFSLGAAATTTCTFTGTPSLSNQVVVGVSHGGSAWPASGTGISDAGLNSYALEKAQAGTAGTRGARLIRAAVLSSTVGAITITGPSAGTTFFSVTLWEVTGANAGAVDTTSGNNGVTSPYACGTTTTTTANDLLLSVLMNNTGLAGAGITQPTGFTLDQALQSGATNEAGGFASFPLSGTVSTIYQWTAANNNDSACAVIALKPAVSATPIRHRVINR